MTRVLSGIARVLIVLPIVVSSAWAQDEKAAKPEQPAPPKEGKGDHDGPPWRGGNIEDMSDKDAREMVEMYRLTKLAEILKLNDEQTVVMVKNFREMREKRENVFKERMALMQQLKDAVQNKQGDAVIEEKLTSLMETEAAYGEVRRETFKKAGEGLTAEQRAKLYVFLNEFDGDVRRMIQQVRHRRDGDNGKDGRKDGRGPDEKVGSPDASKPVDEKEPAKQDLEATPPPKTAP
jgi:hypothetical protein